MAINRNVNPLVYTRTYYKDTVVPKSALFGLVKWEEVISTEKLAEEVIIYTDLPTKILPLSQCK